VAIFYGQIEIK